MRILVITNYYPPYFVGGYELGCRDVVEGLSGCGHDVSVLTSVFGVGRPESRDGIYRWLETDLPSGSPGFTSDLPRLLVKETRNRNAFNRLCRTFRPDVVYAWNLTYISVSSIFAAQRAGIPVCYFVSDVWLSQWESDSWVAQWNGEVEFSRRLLLSPLRLLLNLLGLLPKGMLDLRHVQFASEYLKRTTLTAGKPVENAKVFHWGVDVAQFRCLEKTSAPKRLLYVGQLIASKGISTALEAFKLIVEQPRYRGLRLTVVGGPDYNSQVGRLISTMGIEQYVHLMGQKPREELPRIYREHDILVFPSLWEEPFSITLLEGMASGLAIVSTCTGGSGEILADEENALIFPKGDAARCADQILRLVNSPDLFERVRNKGRQLVEDHFRIERMVEKIDCSLRDIAGV